MLIGNRSLEYWILLGGTDHWCIKSTNHFTLLDACSHTIQCTFPLILSPDLWKFTEILPNASVQTMPLHFGWSCRTFPNASHVHVIHIWGIWAPSQVVDEIWLHIVTTTNASPEFWELAEILPDASVQTMPLRLGWGCRTFQTASHIHVTHK